MSKVYSFRLDENNPREAQAREVIDTWVSNGYSLRHVITESLIAYGKNKVQGTEINAVAEQIIEFLMRSTLGQTTKIFEHNDKDILSTNFINAVKRSAKAGTKGN